MKLLSWNIQSGIGIDRRVDLRRTVDTARALVDFDVLCLQEVADNYPFLGCEGNQFAQIAALLPGYHAVEGPAVERWTDGLGWQRFGNLLLSRFPVLHVFRHQLPWPAEPDRPTMPRLALETVLMAPHGPMRVTTTHLEFYSERQRNAGVEALRALQADAASHRHDRVHADRKGGPFETRPRPASAILTGDFNCPPQDAAIARLQAPLADAAGYADAWAIAHPGQPHAPTSGLYDDKPKMPLLCELLGV